MFFFKPKSYLGIDLGAGGVKLVELQLQKHRPVLFTYGLTSLAQDVHHLVAAQDKRPQDLLMSAQGGSALGGQNSLSADAVAERVPIPNTPTDPRIAEYAALLKDVCRVAKTKSKNAVVSLPVSAVFHTIVNLPVVKREEVDGLLKAEIKKLLPYALEETALDYELLPRTENAKMQTVLVNAVPKSLVFFYSKIFQQAGLELSALEPESVALSRSLVGRDRALTMVIDIGAERTNFFIIDQTVPMTHHSIELGGQNINSMLQSIWGVAEPLIEQLKQDVFTELNRHPDAGISKDRLLSIFMPIIDPIAKEIGYSFDLYLRQSGNEGKRPEKIILTGGSGVLPLLASHLADIFKIKCYIGDPWGRVVHQEGLKNLLNQIGPRMSVAIGLALRNLV